jgi:hypothetical protein|tara:strand:+ start:945 stop:1082 length:138 start_codon:yes stop_codon:yes gene_type:complete
VKEANTVIVTDNLAIRLLANDLVTEWLPMEVRVLAVFFVLLRICY